MAESRRFIEPDDVETMVFDWGSIKWLCEPGLTGSNSLTAGVVVMGPGGGHGRHNHPGAEEVLYVISGEGEQMVEDDAGNPIVRHVRPGSVVYIPEGVYHSTDNTGWEPMRVLAIYTPAGPEKALRELPDFQSVPAGQVPHRDPQLSQNHQ